MTTAGYANLRNIFRADYSPDHDAWGSVMGFLFPIAELLYVEGEDVPSSWEFRPSPLLTHETFDSEEGGMTYYLSQDWLSGYFTADDLRDFGNVLNRYSTSLRARGKDY